MIAESRITQIAKPNTLLLFFGLHRRESTDRRTSREKKADEISPGVPIIVGYLAAVHAAARDERAFNEIMDHLNKLSNQRYVSPYLMARIHASIDHSKALEWLECVYQQRAEWMVLIKTESGFDDMRSEPRFQDLMHRINFPK